eukprot:g11691.t1
MAAPPRPLGDDIEDAQGSNGGGNTTLSLARRRSRGRRSRRVGPCGALLLMSTLVQRSMGAGSFFKGSNRGNTAPARPPASSNQRNENGNAHLAPPGEDRGGRGAALSPTMYTRVSRSPADAVGQAAAGRDRAAGAAAQQAGGGAGSLKGRHLAGMGGSANNPQRQERPPGFRSGRTTAGMTSAGGSSSIGGGGDSGGEEQAHQPSSDPRNSHIAKSLLERNNRATQPRRTTGTIATTRGDGASTWRGAGGGGGVGQGHTYAAVVSPPETVRREAFLAAGRTPSGRRAALEPRAGAGGEAGGGGGGPAAFDPYRNQQGQQQGQGFSGQDPWDSHSGHENNVFNHGRGQPQEQQQQQEGFPEGGPEGVPEGVPGSSPPPRTPLQEQAFQKKYQHQRTQIPGQAVGTQPASSSLFRRAGSGGVFFIFVILVCRALNHYEYADQMTGALRALSMAPAVGLFVGNLVCMCLSLVQSATNRQKARMKTMLTVNAVSEAMLLSYNMLLMLGGSSALVPREEFISRMLTNVLFMSLCFTFAKARWVADGAF